MQYYYILLIAQLHSFAAHYQDNVRESREVTAAQKVQIQQLQEDLQRETHVLKSLSEEERRNKDQETGHLNDMLNKVHGNFCIARIYNYLPIYMGCSFYASILRVKLDFMLNYPC